MRDDSDHRRFPAELEEVGRHLPDARPAIGDECLVGDEELL